MKKFDGKNFLVTGGAGFVGSSLAHDLIQAGARVTIVDNLSNGKKSNLPVQAAFLHEDLAEKGWRETLKGQVFDAIFHLGAQASNAVSFRDPILDSHSNLLGTVQTLEFARESGCKRFIFASSMSAYGDPEHFPTTEQEPLRPK